MSVVIANTAHAIRFIGGKFCAKLSDGRRPAVPHRKIPWLSWLAKATPKQRNAWSLEPGGFAIYWDQLDDGIEIGHLLAMEAIV